ncbi:MAG: hypothetical protein CO098_00285 [Bacteroidetes bacterium CG_4_9_14_3_um_filter_41_19]|nr:MAG: hypothetical protein CO098_00285 [Bacteroidetes bacterium CG_4_9_14_3_um_filter_41_19]
MRKSLIFVQLVIIYLVQNLPLFGQGVENDWVLYPNIVKFNTSPPVISSLPNISPPYGYTDSNGAFDDAGNLLFYIVDSYIYDNASTFVGLLLEANTGYSLPIRETNIVPVPGNNSQYYVIYSHGMVYEGQDLLYATIDFTNGTCTIINNANLLNHYTFGNNNGIAVSRLFSDNTRRMYVASNDFIKRYEISSSAITFEENILVYPNTYGLTSYDFDAFQLEISNDCSKLAWGSILNMTVRSELFLPELNIIELDGDGSFANYYSILASDENFEPTWHHTIIGVEFASDNSKVYFNVSDGDRTGGIFCYNFDLGLLSNVIYDEYNVTQLQSDANGYIYAVSNDGDDIGKIDPTTNTIATDYLDIDILSTTPSGGWFLYALPDLIDYNSILRLNATSTYESCVDNSDGTAIVTVNGGVPPYTFQWDDPSGQTTPTALNLSPGLYTCTVTDALNESTSISVEVSTDPNLFTHIGDWEVYTLDGIYGFAAIDGSIEIFNGGTFIINGTAEFNADKGIIIHEGGTLILEENSVVSGLTACNNNNWDGVLVEKLAIIDINNVTTISKGDLIIDIEANAQFQHVWINFEDNNTILKQGAELTLQNSTFTSLPTTTWQGIQVWGNKNESQQPLQGETLKQGKLTLNNVTIENAIIAVDLWEPDDYSTTGGMVYADGAIFRNNAKSVHALHYRNFNPYNTSQEMEYSSNFKNCTFEITNDYPGDVTFFKHVDLAYVNGIDFQACDFSLAEDVAGVNTYSHGIAGYDAKFRVSAICNSTQYPCPEVDYDKCTFTGFYNGVSAVNDGGSPVTFSVNRADFIDNAYGVKTHDMNNASVLFSDFEIGHLWDCGAGIYSDNVTGFAFEENNFSKFSSGSASDYFGIIINNSEGVNEIYKNNFNDLSYANFSDGKNWIGINTYIGLAYYCNENANNYADFYVNDFEREKRSGIQSYQGNENYVSGNTFTQIGATWHFYNGGEHLVGYYHNPNNTPILIEDIFLYPINTTNNCLSHYGNPDLKLVLTTQQKADAEQEYYNNLTDYNSVKALYDSYIDGGYTEGELLDIQTAQPDDMWELRAQLLGDSPHLSLEVLKEAADKTDVFTESALFDILAANPDELKKDTLISYLENKEEPLPDYMIDLLKQLAGGTTYKTALQQQMAGYKHAYTRAAHDIIRSNLNDTVADNIELRNWLDNLGGITSDRQIISSYISKGNFTDALTLANMLPQLYNLGESELTEHNYYMDMLNLHQALYLEGRNTFQLDSTEKMDITFIANNSKGVAGAQAKSILEAVYDEYYVSCPEADGKAGYKRSSIINPNALGKAYGLDISVKPNPAKQWAAFDYTLPGNKTEATITITNATGSIIEILKVNGQQGQKLWDTRDIISGVYIYTIQTAGFSQSGKIVISN